jgi:hypothetical protein
MKESHVTRRIPRAVIATVVLGTLTFSLGIRAAYADEGTLVLLDILANSFVEIDKLSESIATMRKTYAEAKRMAGYADDAYRAFNAFKNYNGQVFAKELGQALDNAFPDAAYYRREASGTGPWAQGTGELQRMVAYCLGDMVRSRVGASACTSLQENISTAQARRALSATFGTVPAVAGSTEIRAVDHESAGAISSSFAQVNRDSVARTQAKALLAQCQNTDGADDDTIAACQAAANTAQIEQLSQMTELTDQVAESNRLQAVRLAQENARRKREINDVIEQRKVILDGADQLGAEPGEIHTDGIKFFDDGKN